jgi:ABC-type multidrug transport system fused ATPase/permease subunit
LNIPLKEYFALLRRYLKPQWLRVLGLAALLLGGIGLQLISPQVIRFFIDAAQTGAGQRALLAAAALFLITVLAGHGLQIATAYVSETVAWNATNGLRTDLTRHVLNLDMGFHNAHTPGELLERIDGDVDRLANFFSQFVLQILNGLLLTAGVLLLLFREEWRLGLTLAVFALLYIGIHAKGQQLATPQWRKERQLRADLSGFVEERLAGVKDIQANGGLAYTTRSFLELLRRFVVQSTRADVTTDVGWTISKVVFDLGTVAAMGMGAFLFQTNAITIGTVYLILHYLGIINGPLDRIGSQLEDLQRIRVSIERVKTLTETRPKIERAGGLATPLPPGPLAVRFEDVSFGYSEGNPVLRNITFGLQPGKSLGLLGRTGSGKTTLSRLLFRLYDVDAGEVRLGDVSLRQADLTGLRRCVGMVTQEVQLFRASVRDNLTLFSPAISDEQILEGLHILGLDAWLKQLPDGLETQLASGGGLSAGEAQLLAFTRVFLKDPGLIILDEASSRLDPATEQLLEQAMDRLLQNRTAIIIAHRLSTVQRADQILILEAGQIKEAGDRLALAADPGSVFAGLLRTGLEEVLA